jgi:hypothetical protein
MSKSKTRVKILIKSGNLVLKDFEGRYLGLVDDDEWGFLVNKPDIAHKAFTSESLPLAQCYNSIGKRALFASTTYQPAYSRVLFLTPVIKYIIMLNGALVATCKDNKEYVAEEVKK